MYYDPIAFCTEAIRCSEPVIFTSVNYRLGALGFLHCPEAVEYLPPNNGYVIVVFIAGTMELDERSLSVFLRAGLFDLNCLLTPYGFC